jgi:alkanesulfonate monooxygenase SsuD/methylene tetrahydromethanopterin reductase-like flavin-dependent oxidoreductase (luciferase family)
VAKYADACNLFGSTETIKRKLSVLKEHCKTVGRDYDSILKTKLGFIVIDNDKKMVGKRVQQITKGMPKERVEEYIVYGTPDDVLKQIELLEDGGIQYLIADLEPYRELEALEIFGGSIIKKMSRSANPAY